MMHLFTNLSSNGGAFSSVKRACGLLLESSIKVSDELVPDSYIPVVKLVELVLKHNKESVITDEPFRRLVEVKADVMLVVALKLQLFSHVAASVGGHTTFINQGPDKVKTSYLPNMVLSCVQQIGDATTR